MDQLTPRGPWPTADAFPVSKDVGNVRNNGAHLVEPVRLEDELDG